MKNLPTWQKPIAWMIVVLASPFVLLWQGWRACKRRIWAGKIYLRKEANRGRS